MDLKNKVVAITGAGQGIGRSIAEMFAAEGANIALIDLKEEGLVAAREACEKLGVVARGYTANVTDEAAVDATMAAIVKDFGRLDGLVNNAGITKDAMLIKVKDGEIVNRMSMDQWNAVIGVNLTGVFLCGRAAAEQMIRLGNGGVIVNISSISRAGNAGQTNYSAAKAGVIAMATAWASELGRYKIRTGSVAPGFTRTEILAAMKPEILEKAIAPVPLKRMGDPSEIAKAVRFIFDNDYFSGRCIDVDGGLRL
ncbi:SDR family oxidoreductase [Stenotrophobium rhamnosiphilum]|uniref:Short chain dehydrogenase n=1 Tax=Stenotrophobium rhamnosiphilum TaxID=2029166 RepID=A0A2T5MKA0_9GAMM|nr:SDR family oxidoreductase [Stenotrophobium rhamnosiphilum]PTU32984.1 short chain dehydrogenase [Stenotrophobium rhamnosiphilum]